MQAPESVQQCVWDVVVLAAVSAMEDGWVGGGSWLRPRLGIRLLCMARPCCSEPLPVSWWLSGSGYGALRLLGFLRKDGTRWAPAIRFCGWCAGVFAVGGAV